MFWQSGVHERRFSTDLFPVFSAGGHHEEFPYGQGRSLSDVLRPAIPLPTSASPPAKMPWGWFWRGCEDAWHARTISKLDEFCSQCVQWPDTPDILAPPRGKQQRSLCMWHVTYDNWRPLLLPGRLVGTHQTLFYSLQETNGAFWNKIFCRQFLLWSFLPLIFFFHQSENGSSFNSLFFLFSDIELLFFCKQPSARDKHCCNKYVQKWQW